MPATINSEQAQARMRAAIIASTDSALKISLNFVRDWKRYDTEFEIYIIDADHAPSQDHVQRLGHNTSYIRHALSEIANAEKLSKYDAILLLLTGREYRTFYELYNTTIKTDEKRPVFVGGAVGIDYRQQPNILYYRSGLDVYWIHSPADKERQDSYKNLFNFHDITEITSGLPFNVPTQSTHENVILFAGQPDVPQSKKERCYIIHKLFDLALAKPDHEIILKPRVKPGEQTFHKVKFYYEDLVNQIIATRPAPPNFSISYAPIDSLLARSKLMLTISSTAAIEARMMGVSLGIIDDFPATPDYGRSFFRTSGCIITFDQIIEGHSPKIDPNWESHNLHHDSKSTEIIYESVKRALEHPPSGPLKYIQGELSDYIIKPEKKSPRPPASPYETWIKNHKKPKSHPDKKALLAEKWRSPAYRIYRYMGLGSLFKISINIRRQYTKLIAPIFNIKGTYGKPDGL